MFYSPIDYVNAIDAAIQRVRYATHFGNHASGDGAVGNQILDFTQSQASEKLAILV